MAFDKKEYNPREKFNTNDSYKAKMKRDKAYQTKVIVRRLPPTMTEEQFLDQISPLPDNDYFYFVKADLRLGSNAFSRAYINFLISDDIFIFKDKFDGYVFLDNKGNEYPAIVEFAPFQKIPKKRSKKRDAKSGTILTDPDYIKFLENQSNPDEVTLPSAEVYLEEIESREKELKANNGVPKKTTPLIEYLKARKIEQQKIREEKREERKRKEIEKKRIREEERRRRKAEKERIKEKPKEKDSLSEKEATDEVDETPVPQSPKTAEPVVQVLKNPEREKDQKDLPAPLHCKGKDFAPFKKFSKEVDKPKKEWERNSYSSKDRPRVFQTTTFKPSDKERSRRDKNDWKFAPVRKSDTTKPGFNSKKIKDEPKETEPPKQEIVATPEKTEKEDSNAKKQNQSQWSPKDKRDNSCPGNVEMSGKTDDSQMTQRSYAKSSKSVTGDDNAETGENFKRSTSNTESRDQSKDPRVERRIRNKDRPSLEIYRPGMRRFSTQRSSPQKEISTSASNSSSPSPTPPLALAKSQAKEGESAANKTASSPSS